MDHPASPKHAASGGESSCLAPHARRRLVLTALCVGLAMAAPVNGQTIYSPGGVGTVGGYNATGNTTTTANIFAWDINANNTTTRDTYAGGGNSTLSITGTGEQFRVILGNGVDLANAFWKNNQTWSAIITKNSGSATLPNFTNGIVFAYMFNGSTYTSVDTSTRGVFSLAGTSTSGYAVNWVAVPEPGTALSGLLLAAGLLRRKR